MKDLEEEFKQAAISVASPVNEENVTGYLPPPIPPLCHHIFPHTQECEPCLFTVQSSQVNPQHYTETKRNGLQNEALSRQLLSFLMNAVNVVKESGKVKLGCERCASYY